MKVYSICKYLSGTISIRYKHVYVLRHTVFSNNSLPVFCTASTVLMLSRVYEVVMTYHCHPVWMLFMNWFLQWARSIVDNAGNIGCMHWMYKRTWICCEIYSIFLKPKAKSCLICLSSSPKHYHGNAERKALGRAALVKHDFTEKDWPLIIS